MHAHAGYPGSRVTITLHKLTSIGTLLCNIVCIRVKVVHFRGDGYFWLGQLRMQDLQKFLPSPFLVPCCGCRCAFLHIIKATTHGDQVSTYSFTIQMYAHSPQIRTAATFLLVIDPLLIFFNSSFLALISKMACCAHKGEDREWKYTLHLLLPSPFLP